MPLPGLDFLFVARLGLLRRGRKDEGAPDVNTLNELTNMVQALTLDIAKANSMQDRGNGSGAPAGELADTATQLSLEWQQFEREKAELYNNLHSEKEKKDKKGKKDKTKKKDKKKNKSRSSRNSSSSSLRRSCSSGASMSSDDFVRHEYRGRKRKVKVGQIAKVDMEKFKGGRAGPNHHVIHTRCVGVASRK